MSRIYQGQSKVTIKLNTGSSLEGVSEAIIMYRKPDKTVDEWTGEITDEVNGIVEHEVLTESELDQTGSWTLWLSLTFNDGRSLVSDAARMRVYKVGVSV